MFILVKYVLLTSLVIISHVLTSLVKYVLLVLNNGIIAQSFYKCSNIMEKFIKSEASHSNVATKKCNWMHMLLSQAEESS